MAMAILRSGALRTALCGGSRPSVPPKRSFPRFSRRCYEAAKWEKITYLGIISCTGLGVYILSWGPDGLFEKKQEDHH